VESYRIPFNKPGLCGQTTCVYRRGNIAGSHCRRRLVHKRAECCLSRALRPGAFDYILPRMPGVGALLLEVGPERVYCPQFHLGFDREPFVLRGARPVIYPITAGHAEPTNQNWSSLSPRRTKAIVRGSLCECRLRMETICAIASKYKVALVRRTMRTVSLRATKGKMLGTFGTLGTLSFHETKNIIAGRRGLLHQ